MLAAALLALCGRFPSLRCVCLACWPRPLISSYGGGIISPRGWRCPLPAFAPRFARFPPFWRPFGVAVVSNAGAVSLRPFRWCRCACKVATPRAALLCRYPQRGRYLLQQSQRETIPPHGRAVCLQALRPCCWSLVAIAPPLVLAACYRAGGVSSYASNPARPCGGGVLRPRRAYLVNLSNNFPPMLAAGGRAGYRAPPMV